MDVIRYALATPFLLLFLAACDGQAPTAEPEAAAPAVTAAVVEEAPTSDAAAPEDPYLWLEEVEGDRALAWVEDQNDVSLGYLEALPTFEPLYERNLEIYNSDERIPMPAIRGAYVYNFWRDAEHVRGLWRRTFLEQYLTDDPVWETVLDFDALAEAEGENWVFKGASPLEPDYRYWLINLSRGGGDATVVREFDAVTIAFGSGGLVPAVGIVVAIAIGQGVLEPLLSTRLQREALNLDPVVSFGSTIVGSALAGVLGATLSAPIVGMTLRINQRIKDYKEFGPDYDRAAAEAAAEEEAAKGDAGEAEPSGASQPG